MKSPPVELKLHIDAYEPETIPMESLAAYMADLAQVLGETASVHFNRLEGGSTTLVARVDREATPRVLKQAHMVRANEGPPDAQRAKRRMERRLAEQNARNAELTDESGARILLFRGRDAIQQSYGPVRQNGELIGRVIMVGGKNDPVPVHIEDGERVYVCEARRDVVRRLAKYLFDAPIRATGYGRWFRDDQGQWEMQMFRINDFDVLDSAPVGTIIQNMRAVRSKWIDSPDPLARFRESDE